MKFDLKKILPGKKEDKEASLAATVKDYDSESIRGEIVEKIKQLVLESGEYSSGTQTESDILETFVQKCDESTGENIKNTVSLVRIIIEGLSEEGNPYAPRMTDAFKADVIAAAPLHDIGKIMIPDAILNKPGKLTFEEAMNVIKKDAGTHFDPVVAKAFVDAADKVREAASY